MPARLFVPIAAAVSAPVFAQGLVFELRTAGPVGASALAPAGDVDADGYPDIAVGSAGYINAQDGFVRVFSGRTTQELYRAYEDPGNYSAGLTLANLGDLDGDGRGDVVVSAPGATSASGLPGARGVVVLSGATGAVLRSIEGRAAHESFGRALAVVGDADGDGLDDLVVGSPFASGLAVSAGRVDLLSSASGNALWSVAGTAAGESLGQYVGEVGDLDGDGRRDFALVRRVAGATLTEAE